MAFHKMVLAMKKTILCILVAATCTLSVAPGNFKTTRGEITFNASTPLEDIHAVNNGVNAILKTEQGEFASLLLMKDFDFKRKLMQEHFNENYVESETYPKAYFTGKIKDFESEELTTIPKNYDVEGELTIHGVTRKFSTTAALSKKGKAIVMVSGFIIKPEEFKIEVPKLLFKKIAQEVKVDVAYLMAGQ